jgi:hypothetical protein
MSGEAKMATIGELATIVAEAEGVDEPTVALVARYAREAGFIQKKGRGPSAASMLTADAANLLIAVNASTSTATAAEVVPVYRNLVAVDWTGKVPGSKSGGTFGEALELLIDCTIAGRLPEMFSSAIVSKPVSDAFEQGHAELSVTFFKPNPFATIQIHTRTPDLADKSSFANMPLIYACALSFVPMNSRPSQKRKEVGDREDQTKIGKVTIFSVAKILRPRTRRRGAPEMSGS